MLIGIVALTVCFWFLDSFYLLSERKLRKLYEDSVKKYHNDEEIILFSMDTKHLENKGDYYSIFGVMFSRTEIPLYLILLLFEITIMLFLDKNYMTVLIGIFY